MNQIINNYNSLVAKYQKIEADLTENEIHDKRVILRKIFPILAVYKIKESGIKNGEKTFKIFGKLRDVQVQIMKLESIEQTPEILEYLNHLKMKEILLKNKILVFSENRKLKFPFVRRKANFDPNKLFLKANKLQNKIAQKVHEQMVDDAEDIHKIRIAFKKLRYVVEVISYIDKIEDDKLEKMKMYQDQLGEIQDYQVMINNYRKYFKKQHAVEADTENFEHEQYILIEKFSNQIESFVEFCLKLVPFNYGLQSLNPFETAEEIN